MNARELEQRVLDNDHVRAQSAKVADMMAKIERRMSAHMNALDVQAIMTDHESLWRDHITRGVFSTRTISYETANRRLDAYRKRFGESEYERLIIGFAIRYRLYPDLLVD